MSFDSETMPPHARLLIIDSSRLQYEHIFFNCGLYEFLLAARNYSYTSVLCSDKTFPNYSNVYSKYLAFAFRSERKYFNTVSVFHSSLQKFCYFLFSLVRGSHFCFPNPGFDDLFLVSLAVILFRRPSWIFLHGRITEKLIINSHHPFKRILQANLCLVISFLARTGLAIFISLTPNDIFLSTSFLKLLKCHKYIGHRIPSVWREFILTYYNISPKALIPSQLRSVVFPGAFVESRGSKSFIDLALEYRNYNTSCINFKVLGPFGDLQDVSSIRLASSGIIKLSDSNYIEPQKFYSELMHALIVFFCPDNKGYTYRASGVLLECLALGIPILAPHTAITDQYYKHYRLPILFYRSICEACEIIESILNNPKFCKSLESKSRISKSRLSSLQFYNDSHL